jgi:isoleucyl-tRNA synthetase
VRDEQGEEMHKSKGNAIDFNTAADKMGADVCRWLYCRHAPAQNLNFGYSIANDLRAKFHLKLWNVYAFFCNYARLDGFDPANAACGLADLQDIDRWILSDLQLLIQTAHTSFQAFDMARFCTEAERFVDEKLSNWYVRRNRRRFWKGEKGKDKDAAYQTLYTVLTTLAKLFAPIIPFYSELMWQNLRRTADAESVHLCDYPVADAALIDTQLSADMEALLSLVTLGGAARNVKKIKVRQPLAELKVQPGSDADRRAVERFADQITDELNVRKVTLHDLAVGPMLRAEIKPNRKNLGPKFGPRLNEVCAAIEKLTEPITELQLSDDPVTIELSDLYVTYRAVAEGWEGVADRTTQVAIDTRITEELALAGMAREIVRFVQDLRKKADLEMEDRIALSLTTAGATLQKAIEVHRDYIAAETLTVQWVESIEPDMSPTEVQVDGTALQIGLRKLL